MASMRWLGPSRCLVAIAYFISIRLENVISDNVHILNGNVGFNKIANPPSKDVHYHPIKLYHPLQSFEPLINNNVPEGSYKPSSYMYRVPSTSSQLEYPQMTPNVMSANAGENGVIVIPENQGITSRQVGVVVPDFNGRMALTAPSPNIVPQTMSMDQGVATEPIEAYRSRRPVVVVPVIPSDNSDGSIKPQRGRRPSLNQDDDDEVVIDIFTTKKPRPRPRPKPTPNQDNSGDDDNASESPRPPPRPRPKPRPHPRPRPIQESDGDGSRNGRECWRGSCRHRRKYHDSESYEGQRTCRNRICIRRIPRY